MRVAMVGHVDHGKSTLVGRLLKDMNALPAGKVEAVAAMCERRGMKFEWAFVTDALQAERDQGITIDSSHINFSSNTRDYILIDAPGHREFIKNMISGSSDCDGAVVVIDAKEGVREQSRRHALLLHLLGVRQIAVAVTKMDSVSYDEKVYQAIKSEFSLNLQNFDIEATRIIPTAGLNGDNVVTTSENMAWYDGPTLIEALEEFREASDAKDLPFRIPVQDIYRFDDRRIVAGRVDSGEILSGDTIIFSPSNRRAIVNSIENWPNENKLATAVSGDSIGITLKEQIFVERGEVISHADNPPVETNVFRARVFWLGSRPLSAGESYRIRCSTAECGVEVESIEAVIDVAEMDSINNEQVPSDCVGDIVLRTDRMLALDSGCRIVIADGYNVVAGGLVDTEGYPDQRQVRTQKATNITAVEHGVSRKIRAERNGHAGGVIWMTGLSGSGKSTLSVELERQLFARGYQVVVLDGDNLRYGLNANLGFSPEDRSENIRRAGEVAALFAESGFIVVTAFISPYREDRARARNAATENFHEVFISAGLEVCEERDPKGLYVKARAGEISDFTGVSAPYEPPETSEFEVDTGALSVDASVDALVNYVSVRFPLNSN
ncbi:MAG: adenylyl-sulfate kinase [Alphaproteobacteria bacterium]|nr:adenylyl-sulfate kinase [Alphaproteobacteria bacterium]